MNEDYFEETREEGFPVDLTEQEYIAFNQMLARRMGTLRMQKPFMLLFLVYLIVDVATVIKEWMNTGKPDFMLILIAMVTLACAAMTATVMPSRVKKTAKANYLSGNQNGYYGEITVTPYAISKRIGEDVVTVTFHDKSLYVEDRGFMIFSAMGASRSIVLPSRCMTPEMAAKIREAVFAPASTINRRVFARMEALATEPIAKRSFPDKPTTLYSVDFTYNEDELKKLFMDVAMKQYFQSLPTVSAMAIFAGILLALLQEQMWWFPCLSLSIIFGYLLVTVLTAKGRGKKAGTIPTRSYLTLTDQGIDLKMMPNGQHLRYGWQGIERAVERRDCVEFFHSGGNLLRIPKRAIGDFEEFRRIVDLYFKK